MFCHNNSRRGCGMNDSSLLRVLTVGAIVYVGLKAVHHWKHHH
ncbi:hypothetical protein [Sporomusa sp.]|jgi:hypothetical protein|nr:hypothetical protein [Sporomusa sp.]HWR05751.1 hypothetical protein [Sporomusa sp.]